MISSKSKNKITRWSNKPFVTYILLTIIILMYILMTFNGGSQNPFTLITFGAKFNELIVMGEWWRLITPVFLHIGLTHLLFNGLVIYYLGSQLEYIVGHTRYFLLFLLSTIMGNAASFAFNEVISAGASTAIFGFFASTIVLAKLYPNQISIKQLSKSYSLLIVINIFWGLFSQTVDNAGHIGGLVGGYLIMYVISAPKVKNNNMKFRIIYGIVYVVILILLLMIGFWRTGVLIF